MLLADLLAVIYEFLEDRITRVQLEDWIVPRLHMLFADPDSSAADLAATVELGLSELSEGVIDEEEFRSQLRNAVRRYVTVHEH